MNNTREAFLKDAINKKIICFGAGKTLKNVVAFIESKELKIEILLDNAQHIQGNVIEGMTVQAPDRLGKLNADEYILLISSKNYANEIQMQIEIEFPGKYKIYKWPLNIGGIEASKESLWYERMYKPCEALYKSIAEEQDKTDDYLAEKLDLLSKRENVILPRIPVMITTRCTLRCKECSNLMPYYNNPKDYELDDIVSWIRNLSEAVDDWICCELVGGEPFLFKNLETLLNEVLKIEKIQKIEFTTNASVIPNDRILKLLQNKKIHIKISEYPNIIDYSRLAEVFDKYKIKYKVEKAIKWIKTGNLEKRNRSFSEIKSQYLNCSAAKMCRTVLNGKLYVCSKAASLAELGYISGSESVDLLDVANLRENIKEFFQITAANACDYCDIASSEEELVEPAIQIKGKIHNARTD